MKNARTRIARRVWNVERVGSRAVASSSARLSQSGIDVLPLRGAPFQVPPDHVLQAAGEAVRGDIHPPSSGSRELRQAISRKLEQENRVRADPESGIVVTNGAMHALYVAMTALLDPGDEVVVFSPSFFFHGIIEMVGGRTVHAALREEDGFRLRVAALRQLVSKRTKALIVNTPSNPTGVVATTDELAAIAALAEEKDLVVISDESYETMVYDGGRHISIGSLPGMGERTVTIHSFTKSYAMPAWRVGYLAAPAELAEHFLKVLEWMNLACNHVAQAAACAALTGPQEWVKRITADFQRLRDLAFSEISAIEGLSCPRPQGGPFLFPRLRRGGGKSCRELCRVLLERFGVPVVPGDCFQAPDRFRLPFGAREAVVHQAACRLAQALEVVRRA